MRRASLAAGAGVLACACSLVVSLDGLSPSGGSGDASVDGPTGPEGGGAADAGPLPDAPHADVDAARPSPCASPHLFCADFDEADPRAKWTSAAPSVLCVVTPDLAAPSAPRLLRCDTTSVTTPEPHRKEVALTGGKGFTVDVDLAMAVPDGASGFEIDPITFAAVGSGGNAFVALAVYRGDLTHTSFEYNRRLPDGGVEYPGIPVSIPRDGSFHHLRATFASSPPTASIELDGVPVGTHLVDPVGTITQAVVQVGLSYQGGQPPPSVVRIDDVVIDALP